MRKFKRFINGPVFKAYSILLFLLFSSLIGYQIYNRLLRERLPIDLYDPLTNFQVILYSYLLFLNILLLIFVIIYYIRSKAKPKPIGFWGRLGKKISEFFIHNFLSPVSNIYVDLIYNTIPLQYERFWIAVFITFDNLSIPVKSGYFFTVLILPKIIVLVCFLLDVFFFEYIYYFYKALWLLLVPLVLRYLNYVFTLLLVYAPERILEEMDESPVAPTSPLTEEQTDRLLAEISVKMTPILDARYKREAEIRASSWYIRLYHRLKNDGKYFRYNISPKLTADDLYSYNIRTYALLGSLDITAHVFIDIKNEVYVPLNLVLRSGYIIGWSTVLLTHMPFTEKLLEALPPLYFEAFTLWIV